jgi:hypothetical protein
MSSGFFWIMGLVAACLQQAWQRSSLHIWQAKQSGQECFFSLSDAGCGTNTLPFNSGYLTQPMILSRSIPFAVQFNMRNNYALVNV